MISLRSISYILGLLLYVLGLTMLGPALISLAVEGNSWSTFCNAGALTALTGALFIFSCRPEHSISLNIRETFIVATLSWVVLVHFAALPFYFSELKLRWVDCLFEATSAFTTTGASVLPDISRMPRMILLWRAMLQWIGGIGILVTALVAFPTLKVGNLQLFRREFSDRSDKALPKVSQIAQAIFITYAVLTLLCFLCLNAAGMPFFDSLCQSMCTVSTGGMSIHEDSIIVYHSAAIEWILSFFMVAGGTSLVLFVRFWYRDYRAFFQDTQFKCYIVLILISAVSVAIPLGYQEHYSWTEALRHSFFNTISMITSTGFSSVNYIDWPGFGPILFTFLGIIGGCTGSTSGGFKIFRILILYTTTRAYLRRLHCPSAISVPVYDKRKVDDFIIQAVFTFLACYLLCLMILTIIMARYDLDYITAFTASFATLANLGPGLGSIIGPMGSYAPLPDGAKFWLSFSMVIGRLEILTVFALLMPSFWRR